ncbi:MAG: sulfatase-like hydrolase/transferase [Firmicutes bacterium]|nr:sulfatase-like hydrolase/transferase [Bacillota bacterium]
MNSVWKYIKRQRIPFIYLAVAVTLGLVSLPFVDARPYFVHFWLPMLVLGTVIFFLLALPSVKAQGVMACIFLVIQGALVFAGVVLYNSNGTSFQHEMFNMRNDAWGTMEFIPIQIGLVFILILTGSYFIGWCVFDVKRRNGNAIVALEPEAEVRVKVTKKGKYKIKPPRTRMSGGQKVIMWAKLGMSLALATVFICMPIIDGAAARRQPNYHYRLTSMSGDSNQMRGIATNILYETLKFGATSRPSLANIDQLWPFIYEGGAAETSLFNGIASGNNLVFILAESLDTHILERYSPEKTAELFPNMMRIQNGGINMTNFRVKEKTDTAEAFSLLGALPSRGFVHYDFSRNEYPFSLPNKMRTAFEMAGRDDPVLNSFHQNRPGFYNRNRFHPQLGFDRFWSINDMTPYGVVNSWRGGGLSLGRSERTLDSQTVDRMRHHMFPTDAPFFTYWISFVKHGWYQERRNLRELGYYDALDALEMFPRGTRMQNILRNYAAAALDFDAALGYMLEDLEKKGLLANTTIVIVSDHETYYHDLTGYAKGLTHRIDPERFRIPFWIYCQSVNDRFDELFPPAQPYPYTRREIHKFTTMQDIVPTILDLFGVPAWRNLYFGHTIFQDIYESIAFSRVYNFFMNDRLAFFNKNHIDFRTEAYIEGDLEEFVRRAKIHLDKLFWIDRVYFGNFFRNFEYRLPT